MTLLSAVPYLRNKTILVSTSRLYCCVTLYIIWQVRTHLLNAFRVSVITTMETSKKVFNVLSCVAIQTTKHFFGCMPLSQMFLGVKQKPKCKAVDVTELEAIMTQRDQVDILLLFFTEFSLKFSLTQSCVAKKRKRPSALLRSTNFHFYVFKYSILVQEENYVMRFL